ncbi:MAG: DNA-3-methyladenine glycosylase I [Polyangiales bacterium]|jgi:DNA-3-methyladenine glycosylase I
MTNERLAPGLQRDGEGVVRCKWPSQHEDYIRYHDEEWGIPQSDEHRLFEKVCLEGFQAGLSWLTILRKRENFRDAFAEFDFERVARFNKRSVERLLGDAGIVRHRGKIESTINNAKRACDLVDEYGSLGAFFWSFEPATKARPKRLTLSAMQKLTQSAESVAISKELKKRGWSFVGPTTLYAFIQAMGMVNDHIEGCHARPLVDAARASFERP